MSGPVPPGASVDALVAALDRRWRLAIPQRDELPAGSALRALWALPVARFEDRPGYRCWAVVEAPWSPIDRPPFTPSGVVVFLADAITRPSAQDRGATP